MDGPWQQYNLDAGASMIIPVPEPLGGALVVGESVITYITAGKLLTTPIQQTTVRVRSILMRVSTHPSVSIVGHLYLLRPDRYFLHAHSKQGVLSGNFLLLTCRHLDVWMMTGHVTC